MRISLTSGATRALLAVMLLAADGVPGTPSSRAR
jgi:hypothetical protein